MPVSTQLVTRIAADGDAQAQRDKRRSGRRGQGRDGDPRSPSRRDHDKVLYSSAFQRLTGVTQVVTPEPGGALTHNRLTHSLKVAQVARSIAELLLSKRSNYPDLVALGGLDADVAEAAALAHDLGHPPFGHIGESVIDNFAREKLGLREGFEGNAQTFRIVTRLDIRSASYDGMDLTAATRCAVLKYPWTRIDSHGGSDEQHRERLQSDRSYELRWTKFGYYLEEAVDFQEARSIPGIREEAQSVEAAIMDLADDVTYALHDLQDFYLARVLPIPVILRDLDEYVDAGMNRRSKKSEDRSAIVRLGNKLKRNYEDRYNEDEFVAAVKAVLSDVRVAFGHHFTATPDAIAVVSKYVSDKIGQLTRDISITRNPTGERAAVHLRDDLWHQVQVLKHLTSEQVIGRPEMAVYQRAQQRTLLELLEAMTAWWEDPDDQRRLPQPLLEWKTRANDEQQDARRCLVDFVAGLSDHQAAGLRRGLADGGRGLLHELVL